MNTKLQPGRYYLYKDIYWPHQHMYFKVLKIEMELRNGVLHLIARIYKESGYGGSDIIWMNSAVWEGSIEISEALGLKKIGK